MKITYKAENFNLLPWQKLPQQRIKELERETKHLYEYISELRRTIKNLNDHIDLLNEKVDKTNLLLSAKSLKILSPGQTI